MRRTGDTSLAWESGMAGRSACHARPENIWKEQVIGAVQGMVEETNRC
jgi:hypothetical protein